MKIETRFTAAIIIYEITCTQIMDFSQFKVYILALNDR